MVGNSREPAPVHDRDVRALSGAHDFGVDSSTHPYNGCPGKRTPSQQAQMASLHESKKRKMEESFNE